MQLDSRKGHTTYLTEEGNLFQYKSIKNLEGAFVERATYEISASLGVSSVAPVFVTYREPVNAAPEITGILSCVAGTTYLSSFSEKNLKNFWSTADTSALDAETVLSKWWDNWDWKNNLDHVVVCSYNSGVNNYYIYDRDRSWLAGGQYSVEDMLGRKPGEYVWVNNGYRINKDYCLKVIKKIREDMDRYTLSLICFGIADDFTKIVPEIKPRIKRIAGDFVEFLIKSRNQLESEFNSYFYYTGL